MRVLSLVPIVTLGAAAYQVLSSHIQLSRLFEAYDRCIKNLSATHAFQRLRSHEADPIKAQILELNLKSLERAGQGCPSITERFENQKTTLMIAAGMVVVSAVALYFTLLRDRPRKWLQFIRMQQPPGNNTPHETAPQHRTNRAAPPPLKIESPPPVQEEKPTAEELESAIQEQWRKRNLWVMNGARLRNVP